MYKGVWLFERRDRCERCSRCNWICSVRCHMLRHSQLQTQFASCDRQDQHPRIYVCISWKRFLFDSKKCLENQWIRDECWHFLLNECIILLMIHESAIEKVLEFPAHHGEHFLNPFVALHVLWVHVWYCLACLCSCSAWVTWCTQINLRFCTTCVWIF